MRLLALILALALLAEAKPPEKRYEKLVLPPVDEPFTTSCTPERCKLKPTTEKTYRTSWWLPPEEGERRNGEKREPVERAEGLDETCPDCGTKPEEPEANRPEKKTEGDHDKEMDPGGGAGEKRVTGGPTERGRPIPCGRLSRDRMEFGTDGKLLPHRYYEIRVKAEGDSWALGTEKDECVGVMTDGKGKILGRVVPAVKIGKEVYFSELKGRQVGERDSAHFNADFVALPVGEAKDNERNETGLVFFPVSCSERDRKPMAFTFVQMSPGEEGNALVSYVVDGDGTIRRVDEETMLASAHFLKGGDRGRGREVRPPSVLEEPRI